MSNRIFVATRKGLFTVERKRGGADGWEIVQTTFLGDPVTMILPDTRHGRLYAALNLGHFGVKLHRSDDGGKIWKELGVPKYEDEEKEKEQPSEVAGDGPTLKQIWCVEAGGKDEPDLLWAGTLPGGLFVSRDSGETWHLNRPLWDRPERMSWFGGGYDWPGIHSICVDPRDHRHVSVGVSCGGVWVTRDHGETWQVQTKGMYAEYMPPERREDPNIQDPHRLVQCTSSPDVLWVQHHNGVFRSTDGAASWKEITSIQPSKFGFAVVSHPAEPSTAWYVPGVKDECRIPVDGKMAVARTRDGGESFEVLREGLPQEHAYDLVYRHGMDIDETGDRLVIGSTTGGLWITEDQGDHWHLVSSHLPPVYCVRFQK